MKGKVMPLAGNSDTATPILMKACTAVTIARPAPASWQKGSRALAERSRSLHGEQTEQSGDDGAKNQAEFLARHREDIIGVGVGNAVLDRARARPHAGKTAMGEGLQRQFRPDSRCRYELRYCATR